MTPAQLRAMELVEHYLSNIALGAAGGMATAATYNTFTNGPDMNVGAAALAGGLGGAARGGLRQIATERTGGVLHTPITEHFENKYLEDWI